MIKKIYLVLGLCIITCLSACTSQEVPLTSTEYTQENEKTSVTEEQEFEDMVTQIVLENFWDGDIIAAEDVVIDCIYYGSFSESNRNEMLVLCKILHLPHVAGLDKTVCILFDRESLEMKSYTEFGGDEVAVERVKGRDGQSFIVASITAINHGFATQRVEFFSLENCEWNTLFIEPLKSLPEGSFAYIKKDMIIITGGYNMTSSSDVIMILTWDPYNNRFVLNE